MGNLEKGFGILEGISTKVQKTHSTLWIETGLKGTKTSTTRTPPPETQQIYL